MYLPVLQIVSSLVEQALLHLFIQASEGSPVKCHLNPILPLRPGQPSFNGAAQIEDRIARFIAVCPGDTDLVAEQTAVGAAPMVDKKGNNQRHNLVRNLGSSLLLNVKPYTTVY